MGGGSAAVVVFPIDHLQRLPPPEILGPLPLGVLAKSPFNIRSDPGIERLV